MDEVVATGATGAVALAVCAVCANCGTDAADVMLLGQVEAGKDCIGMGSTSGTGGAR